MSINFQSDVRDFHRKFGLMVSDRPLILVGEDRMLRDSLNSEEFEELCEAMYAGDLPGTADAIVDLIYVLLGQATAMGVEIQPLWDAVHEANMKKDGGGSRSDGKILKPDGWVKPDIEGLLRQQGWNGE